MPAPKPESDLHDPVLQSLTWIEPKSDLIARAFYQRLLSKHPDLAVMFANTDMSRLGKQLVATFAWAVRHRDDPASLQERLRQLGMRHKLLGVSPEHFDLVGECFLAALESELGADFSEALRHAWVQAYLMVVSAMQSAYYSQQD